MHSFSVISSRKASCKIDTEVFSMQVISKVVYELSGEFVVMQERVAKDILLSLESKSERSAEEWEATKERLGLMCSDYRMREVVEQETKDIRTILYLKAFANIHQLMEDDDE